MPAQKEEPYRIRQESMEPLNLKRRLPGGWKKPSTGTISSSAEKYGGEMEIHAGDHLFFLDGILPSPA